MGHGVGPYLGLDEIGNSISIIIFIIISYLFSHTFKDLSIKVFVIYLLGFICLGFLGFICYDFLLVPINSTLCYYFWEN